LIVTDSVQAKKIISKLDNFPTLVFDTETTGLKILGGSDVMCGLGVKGLESDDEYYFPRNVYDETKNAILGLFGTRRTLIGQNLKFDMKVKLKEGFVEDMWRNINLHDLLPMYRLYSPERRVIAKLVVMIDKFYGKEAASFDKELKMYVRKNKLTSYADVPVEKLGYYCCKQVRYTGELYKIFKKYIHDSGQDDIWALEVEMTKVLLSMEIYGVPIDVKYCKQAFAKLEQRKERLKQKIFSAAGQEFNLNSPLQVGKVLSQLGFRSPELTPTGAESWGASALMSIDHPVANCLGSYRTAGTLTNTYFGPFIESGGRIHPNFTNWKAVTGRLSCREPNLQNIPRIIVKEDGALDNSGVDVKKMEAIKSISTSGGGGSGGSSWFFTGDEYMDEEEELSVRRAFVPDPGFCLYSFDFHQMEIYVLIDYLPCKKELFKAMSQEGFDFHSYMAKQIYGVKESDPDFSIYRQMAKGVAFGLIYGMGLETLAIAIAKPIDEAKEIRRLYFNKLEGLRKFVSTVQTRVRERGYVYNRFGRRYYITPNKAYVGVNYLIQGTAAEIVKCQMVKLHDFLYDKKTKMLIQIHDELLISVANDEIELIPKIRDMLATDDVLGIPLVVDVAKCTSWAQKETWTG